MKKVMKKIVLICLALLACLSMLVSCHSENKPNVPNNEGNASDESGENNGTTVNANGESTPGQGGNENNGENNSVSTESLWTAEGYSNGLMLVWEGKTDSPKYFINKKGEFVFGIPQSTEKNYGLVYNVSGFLGNYYPINEYEKNSSKGTVVLLDKTGKVIRPDDLGVTDFLIDEDVCKEMLADGYILAGRIEETFMETRTELFVFDNEMNLISDLSGKMEIFDLRNYRYLSGFLYKSDNIIELQTGKVYSNHADMYSKISFDHESDWWKYSDLGYYDIRDGERKPVLSLESLPGNLYRCFEFEEGVAGIVFRQETDSSDFRYYFGVIDEKGELLFEPIKISDNVAPAVKYCGGFYAVATISHIYVFDKTGKIAELQYQEDFYVLDVQLTFSDDVIVLILSPGGLRDKSIYVYTPELKPLFD